MNEFVTHTWNPVKGRCFHDCSYCYMKRWGAQRPLRLDEAELRTDLGEGNFIFVGSSCDLFAQDVPDGWIRRVIDRMYARVWGNKYLWQSKNPARMLSWLNGLTRNVTLCTTIETNREYPEIMRNAPSPKARAAAFERWYPVNPLFVTIEPILDFDLDEFVKLLWSLPVRQVNIGADSGGNGLPEPPAGKVRELIAELERFTDVVCKKNLGRLMG